MKVSSLFFNYCGVNLHSLKYEGGDQILFCFHGYGQQADFFKSLALRLRESHTVYAFDLFYHGGSHWHDCKEPLTSLFLTEIISAFAKENSIERFSLCGYSLGGKLVLSLVEKLGNDIEKLLLIAPDGIQTNLWYSMATYPYWMRWLFEYTISHPGLYFGISNALNFLKIVDKGVIRFARSQMSSAEKRSKVYCTWLTYRKIKPDIRKVAYEVNKYQISLHIFLGSYDRIVTRKSTEPLLRKLDHYDITILKKGHNTLIDDVALHQGPIL